MCKSDRRLFPVLRSFEIAGLTAALFETGHVDSVSGIRAASKITAGR